MSAGITQHVSLVRLRFFRDLVESQRRDVFVAMNAIPHDYDEAWNQGIESRLFDRLAVDGRLPEIETRMAQARDDRWLDCPHVKMHCDECDAPARVQVRGDARRCAYCGLHLHASCGD